MRSLDTAIAELLENRVISREDAMAKATAPDKLTRAMAA
jgi:hypothetical protein